MKLKKQPNSWSCSIAALAMVLDIEIKDVIELIGHDGSEIVAQHLRPPGCYKGFHSQELIDVALSQGYSMTCIEAMPVQTSDGKFEYLIKKWGQFITSSERFEHYFLNNKGIILGRARQYHHMVAFDRGTIYDPRGRIYSMHDCTIKIQMLWLLNQIKD